MLMIKNGSWWIDVEPFCAGFHCGRQAHYSSNLARHGSFSQITNAVISLLIQTGPSFSNSVDCHKAVKRSVTLERTSNDEKWHTGAAPWIPSFIIVPQRHSAFFPPLLFKQLSFTKWPNHKMLAYSPRQKMPQRKKKITYLYLVLGKLQWLFLLTT